MQVSRRKLVKIGAAIPLLGLSVIAYSAKRPTDVEDVSDPCVVAFFDIFTPEVNVESPAVLSTLVINRSRQTQECVVELLANSVIVDRKTVEIPPLEFAFVNMSYTPVREGVTFLGVADFEKILLAKKPLPAPPLVELPEELKRKFESLLPGAVSFESVSIDDLVYYRAFDKTNNLLGFVFMTEVTSLTDRLVVSAAISPDLKISAVDVEAAPDYPQLWKPEIATPKFEGQFIGLTANDLALKPAGKVDAVSGATISSDVVVKAIRKYIEAISKGR